MNIDPRPPVKLIKEDGEKHPLVLRTPAPMVLHRDARYYREVIEHPESQEIIERNSAALQHEEYSKEQRGYPVSTLEIAWTGFEGLNPEQLKGIPDVQNFEARMALPLVLRLAEDDNLRLVLVSTTQYGSAVTRYIIKQAVEKRMRMKGEEQEVAMESITNRLRFMNGDSLVQGRGDVYAEIQDWRQQVDQAVVHSSHGNNLAQYAALQLNAGIDMTQETTAQEFGGKTGNRRIFEAVIAKLGDEAAFKLPEGYGSIHSAQELLDGITKLEASGKTDLVIKIDDSFSGIGNIRIDLDVLAQKQAEILQSWRLTDPEYLEEAKYRAIQLIIAETIAKEKGIPFEKAIEKMHQYLEAYYRSEHGGTVEEWVQAGPGKSCELIEGSGEYVRSPSVQVQNKRVNGRLVPHILSTHDQVLAEDGNTYIGAKYPADAEYRAAIEKAAIQIAEELAEQGIEECFGIDFVVTRNAQGEIEVYPIEVNVRKTGTTYPLKTALHMFDGAYINEGGSLVDEYEHEIAYNTSDHFAVHNLAGLDSDVVVQYMEEQGLLFSKQSTPENCGEAITIHLQGAVNKSGEIGRVVMAGSDERVRELVQQFESRVQAIRREDILAFQASVAA